MKVKNRILTIAILVIIIIMLSINNIYALNTNDFKPSDLTEDDYETAFNMASTIVNTITTIGVVISIIIVIILGIKYMCGSIEQRADYKRTMIPMLVGAILIFTSSTLVSIIYSLVLQLE